MEPEGYKSSQQTSHTELEASHTNKLDARSDKQDLSYLEKQPERVE